MCNYIRTLNKRDVGTRNKHTDMFTAFTGLFAHGLQVRLGFSSIFSVGEQSRHRLQYCVLHQNFKLNRDVSSRYSHELAGEGVVLLLHRHQLRLQRAPFGHQAAAGSAVVVQGAGRSAWETKHNHYSMAIYYVFYLHIIYLYNNTISAQGKITIIIQWEFIRVLFINNFCLTTITIIIEWLFIQVFSQYIIFVCNKTIAIFIKKWK